MEHAFAACQKGQDWGVLTPQDLQEVNKRVEDIHPMVPNPYTLLYLVGPKRTVYTILDLKGAFFCISLARESHPLFAFAWSDPQEGFQGQFTWT